VVVSLTSLPTARYAQEDSWYSFLLEAEGLGQLKNATASAIERATFRLWECLL
jgi:hypothetical protein